MGLPFGLYRQQICLGANPSGMTAFRIPAGCRIFTDDSIMRQIFGLLPNGILAFWPASVQFKEFAFLTANVQLMTAVL